MALPTSRPPRICTTTTVFGNSLDELLDKAMVGLEGFFGSTSFEIIEIRAEPHLQTMTGDVLGWRGEVEAGQVANSKHPG